MKQKQSFHYFIILVILSLGLFLGERTGVLFGFRKTMEGIFVPWQEEVYSKWQNFSREVRFWTFWKNGQKKLENCQEHNRELLVKAARVGTLEAENKVLREQLKVGQEIGKRLILAQVIGFRSGIKLNKGNLDGVKKGMVVVFGSFLVGKITDVSPTTSHVELPTDSHSKIAVQTSQTSARGILSGQFDSGLLLDSVLQEEELILGDTLVTSGENGIFPPDLLAGKIVHIEKNEAAVFQKATVEPLISYSSLQRVFLILE